MPHTGVAEENSLYCIYTLQNPLGWIPIFIVQSAETQAHLITDQLVGGKRATNNKDIKNAWELLWSTKTQLACVQCNCLLPMQSLVLAAVCCHVSKPVSEGNMEHISIVIPDHCYSIWYVATTQSLTRLCYCVTMQWIPLWCSECCTFARRTKRAQTTEGSCISLKPAMLPQDPLSNENTGSLANECMNEWMNQTFIYIKQCGCQYASLLHTWRGGWTFWRKRMLTGSQKNTLKKSWKVRH